MDYAESRLRLVKWLRAQLIGPASEEGSLNTSPLERYPVGVLSPVTYAFTEDIDAPQVGESEDGQYDDNSFNRFYTPPSSVGFSFLVSRNARLSITVSAATYVRSEERDKKTGQYEPWSYVRESLPSFQETVDSSRVFHTELWESKAGLTMQTSPHDRGMLCTVALFNRQSFSNGQRRPSQIDKYLFEARIECAIDYGRLLEFPRTHASMLTDEEQEIELQYRNRKIYGAGHGSAVDWSLQPNGMDRIWSEFMPAVEIPALSTNPQGNHSALSLDRLQRTAINDLMDSINDFVRGYETWVASERCKAAQIKVGSEQDAARRMVARMEVAIQRMRQGAALLEEDPNVACAFRVANRAMLNQMRQADVLAGKDIAPENYRWRSFQLAFLLTVLESVVNENSDFRDAVDLIWFPTGGGKTEAYLGLIAFLMVWRRLEFSGKGAGTVAIMRYTLRLLTRQQFERAARMVCALELIRRKDPARLGQATFTTGIWVGGAVSPNSFTEAKGITDDLRAGDTGARYKLVVTICPWCGEDLDIREGYQSYPSNFEFHCVQESDCEFGSDTLPLPCQVVDEALYKEPPSLLISTIDKFARMTWISGPRAFIGDVRRAPDLVIQDELHLVSGPLGSVSGMYEAGLETAILHHGVKPKYIASTATISQAREQVKKLYARNVRIFPPPGLSCDDNYFSCTDNERPGRMYLGFLAPGLTRRQSLGPIAAALLTAPGTVFGLDSAFEDLAEAWWTIVVFNRSLKDVARSHTAILNDAQVIGERILDELPPSDRNQPWFPVVRQRIESTHVAELTSMRSAEECAATFNALAHHHKHEQSLDLVLATNMISVGLDVSRLSIMIVNGQPQSTGEYIQTTSRVGRAEVPGLVVVNYYRNQARSLAHYESFRPFHESFYRFVEPSSVTPFTYQVRRRALHAALVIALRHSCNHLCLNDEAVNLGKSASAEQQVILELFRRCQRACEQHTTQDEIRSDLSQLQQAWIDMASKSKNRQRRLRYRARSGTRDADRLLTSIESSDPGLWRTLNSMRNVERSAILKGRLENAEADIRISNLLREYGVGSIIRMDVHLAAVPDIHLWDPPDGDPLKREIQYVTQIRKSAKIGNRKLVKPPVGTRENGRIHNWIPAAIFPRWTRCRKCDLLHYAPWKEQQSTDALCSSTQCDGRLEQVRWVLTHRNGYLADVDWHFVAHVKAKNPKQESCRGDRNRAYLKLKKGANGPVKCTKCGASGWTIFLPFGKWTWQQPWLREPPPEHTLDCLAEVMQVGDTRVFLPETVRALVIPPESRIRRGTVVDRLFGSSADQHDIARARPGLDKKSTLRRLSSKYDCTVKQLIDAMEKIERGYPLYGVELEAGEIEQLEYEALTHPIPNLRPDEDFITRHFTDSWKSLTSIDAPKQVRQVVKLVDHLVSVDRIRMISVFTGFRRAATNVHRAGKTVAGKASGASIPAEPALVPPDIHGRSDWLPAGELFGEGVFLTLSEPLLRKWEEHVKQSRLTDAALDTFLMQVSSDEDTGECMSSRFVLCHSLAHLLIRQLERTSGYAAASIQERIYCGHGENAMAGILLYVAVADDFGSLGGLMEYARPNKFLRLVTGALDSARWCSFDPVCSRHSGEQYGQLNGAACHACLMLPEPSCCNSNQFLDRTLIKGNGESLLPILELIDK